MGPMVRTLRLQFEHSVRPRLCAASAPESDSLRARLYSFRHVSVETLAPSRRGFVLLSSGLLATIAMGGFQITSWASTVNKFGVPNSVGCASEAVGILAAILDLSEYWNGMASA